MNVHHLVCQFVVGRKFGLKKSRRRRGGRPTGSMIVVGLPMMCVRPVLTCVLQWKTR